jgi:type II secretory pathway component PulC
MDRTLAFQDLTAKWTNSLPQAGLLAATAIVMIATVFLLYQALHSYLYQPAISPSQQQSTATTPTYSISNITNSHLFGRADSKSVEQLTLPKTRKPFQLRGAFTATNPESASAIIESADKEARHYKVGAQVQDGVKLYAVYGDRVVLSNRGQLETLYFPSHEEMTSSRTAAIPATKQEAPAAKTSANIDISKSVKTEAERNALIRQRLEELRNRIRKQ